MIFAKQEYTHRGRAQCMDTKEEREGENWESCTDTYKLPCVKQVATGKLLFNTGNPA